MIVAVKTVVTNHSFFDSKFKRGESVIKDILYVKYDQKNHCEIKYLDLSVGECDFSAIELFDNECLKYGSTYEGRINCFRKVLNVKQKPCILVDSLYETIFMPTLAASSINCFFINYKHIDKVNRIDGGKCNVIFFNKHEIEIPCDGRVLRKQMLRTRHFLDSLCCSCVHLVHTHNYYML